MPGAASLPPIRGQTAYLPVPLPDQITLETLAALYLGGVRRILAEPVGGDPGGPGGEALVDRVARLNALLRSRGLPRVVTRSADQDEAKAWRRVLAADRPADVGRRGFLSRLATAATEAESQEEPEAPALSRLQALEADQAGVLFAHVAVIRADLCNGCDACITICPRNALILSKDRPGRHRNTLSAQDCDGCGLCVDVCEPKAIRLAEMAERPDGILLDVFACRSCGVEVHEPTGHGSGDGLCRICRQTDHRRMLHQVLT